MNKVQRNQILLAAIAIYYNVLAMLFEMMRHNAAALGLMAPGIPDQLAVYNGVGVTENGVPFFLAAVKRRGNVFHSQMEFGRAVQEALDVTCYANCAERLVLQHVDPLPNGYIGLTLTVEGW